MTERSGGENSRSAPGYRDAPNSGGLGGPFEAPKELNIEVQRELPGVRAEPHRVHLVLALVLDPRLDDVRREHVALEEPVVRLLEVVQDDAEVAGQLLDLLRLRRLQLIQVLVDWLAGVDFVGDAVEAGHQARREGEIGVARVVRRPELDSLGTFGLRVHPDADAGRAVALAVDEIDRRLVAWHQALVGVGGRRDDGQPRWGVLEDTGG